MPPLGKNEMINIDLNKTRISLNASKTHLKKPNIQVST